MRLRGSTVWQRSRWRSRQNQWCGGPGPTRNATLDIGRNSWKHSARAVLEGTAYGLEDHVAVALWLAPGVEPDGEALMSLFQESMDDQRFEDIGGVFEQFDEHHPTYDHWYLPLMGVEPASQGRRLGSTLLQHTLDKCDRDGLPAYLEATSPRSRNLYARHGFDDVATIQAGSSPPLWAMLREPDPSVA